MRAEPCSMGEALPRRRVVGDEVAYAPRGGAVGMPQAAADEAVARRDVDVKARCVHFAMALVIQAQSGPCLVRGLVVAEAGVAMDATQRATDRARVGDELRAQFCQWCLTIGDPL